MIFFINDKARNHQNKEMINAGNIQFIIFIIKSKSKIFICLATLSCCDLNIYFRIKFGSVRSDNTYLRVIEAFLNEY